MTEHEEAMDSELERIREMVEEYNGCTSYIESENGRTAADVARSMAGWLKDAYRPYAETVGTCDISYGTGEAPFRVHFMNGEVALEYSFCIIYNGGVVGYMPQTRDRDQLADAVAQVVPHWEKIKEYVVAELRKSNEYELRLMNNRRDNALRVRDVLGSFKL